MYFILAEERDEAAAWAARGLEERGLKPVASVTMAMLARGARWEHRVGVDGVRTVVRFDGGTTLDSATARGVLNRIPFVPVDLFTGEDREYAQQEFTALLMSALGGLECPVWNRPVAQGTGGAWRHPSEWLMLAGRAGLRARDYRARPALAQHTVFVLDGRVVGAPARLREACVRFGALAQTGLVGLEFDEEWVFTGATPQPDLRFGGDALLDALAEGFAA